MAVTLPELKQRLIDRFDIDDLIELFKLTPEQLVEACSDIIDEDFERLANEVFDEDELSSNDEIN